MSTSSTSKAVSEDSALRKECIESAHRAIGLEIFKETSVEVNLSLVTKVAGGAASPAELAFLWEHLRKVLTAIATERFLSGPVTLDRHISLSSVASMIMIEVHKEEARYLFKNRVTYTWDELRKLMRGLKLMPVVTLLAQQASRAPALMALMNKLCYGPQPERRDARTKDLWEIHRYVKAAESITTAGHKKSKPSVFAPAADVAKISNLARLALLRKLDFDKDRALLRIVREPAINSERKKDMMCEAMEDPFFLMEYWMLAPIEWGGYLEVKKGEWRKREELFKPFVLKVLGTMEKANGTEILAADKQSVEG